MYTCNRPGTRLIAALAFALSGTAQASTVLLSENFNSAIPGTIFAGSVPGSFVMGGGSVDVLGNLHGSFFLCPDGPGNNCIDLNGSGPGTIRSAASFNLVAGNTYELSFDLAPGPESEYKATVSLGSHTGVFTAVKGTGFVHMSMLFTQSVADTGVKVTFSGAVAPGKPAYWGPVIDNVVLTETTPPVPEPETYAMCLAGLGLLGAAARRRKAIAV